MNRELNVNALSAELKDSSYSQDESPGLIVVFKRMRPGIPRAIPNLQENERRVYAAQSFNRR
jgi:hypothetical protein